MTEMSSFPFDKPTLHRLTSSVCSPQSPGGPIWSPVSSPTTSSPPPEIILLALWPHATDSQIDYYVQSYAYLFPSSRVLLLRHAHRQSSKEINAALAELTHISSDFEKNASYTSFEKPGTHQPQILLHFFGAKAAKQLTRLLRAYQLANAGQNLNAKTIILDSEPSTTLPTRKCLKRSPSKACLSMLKTILSVVGTCGLSLIYQNYTSTSDSTPQLPAESNALLPAEAGRCYVASAQDKMFYYRYSSRDGKETASSCEKREFEVVRSAVGGKPGRQWTRNEERYWMGIEEVWEES